MQIATYRNLLGISGVVWMLLSIIDLMGRADSRIFVIGLLILITISTIFHGRPFIGYAETTIYFIDKNRQEQRILETEIPLKFRFIEGFIIAVLITIIILLLVA